MEISTKKRGLFNYNLRYFKTGFVAKSKSKDEQKLALTKNCEEMICIKENIFNKITENDAYSIYESNNKNRYLAIYTDLYDDEYIENMREELKMLEGEKVVYVFSFDNYTDANIIEGIENCRIEPIPARILETFNKIQILVRD